MNILLVDDEPLARARMRRMFDVLPEYTIVGEADSGLTALAAYEVLKPDLVLMDIRMPGMDGLEAAQRLSQLPNSPAVVFCTAYDDYALQAFDAEALGYLLKPVSQEKLLAALHKVQRMLPSASNNLAGVKTTENYLTARTHRGLERIALSDCRYFLADSKYVTAYHRDGELIIDETLKQLEDQFADVLLRVHRNALVSRQHVQALEKAGDHYRVRLSDCAEGPLISRRMMAEVKAALGFD
jgi:two-component system response regulator AlgR